jgi:hypothetical protein
MLGELQRQVAIHVGGRQQRHRDVAADPVYLQLELHTEKRVSGGRQLRGPVGAHDQHPVDVTSRCQVREHVNRGRVRPVQVIEEEDHRLTARQLLEERQQLTFQPLLAGHPVLGGAAMSRTLVGHAGNLHVPAWRDDAHELPHRFVAAALQCVESLQQGQVGLASGQTLGAASSSDEAAQIGRAQFAQKRFHDRRLADPGFTGQTQQSSMPDGCRFEGSSQVSELFQTADDKPLFERRSSADGTAGWCGSKRWCVCPLGNIDE